MRRLMNLLKSQKINTICSRKMSALYIYNCIKEYIHRRNVDKDPFIYHA